MHGSMGVRVGSVPEDTEVGFAVKFWGSLPTINDKGHQFDKILLVIPQ
jgi:hypothetical protein